MKKISLLLFIAFFVSGLGSCTKEKTLAEVKEAMIQGLTEEISADSLHSYVRWMEDMGTRFCLADNRREVAAAIRDKFISFGYASARLDSFLLERTYRDTNYSLWQYNVTARLEGSLYPDSLSILGGHYDSILGGSDSDPFTAAPGAHDNASGVAAALEVARVMKEENFKPEGSIVFIAFAAEELGLHGSIDYCIKAARQQAKIKMMLNNDMIAYEPSSDMDSWKVNIMNYENSGTLLNDANRLATRHTVLNSWTDNRLNSYSDSFSFSQYGYPALFFFKDADDPYYHSLNDITDNCNFTYCREIVKISAALLVDRNIYNK
ncbi:MAG: M20/M25/M40 family metallo-hydrolase [Bacteroidales bacterium]|nr:M20/M25/M40 family metallo-hydrolase [Bacteroidales bacterium]